MLLYAVLALAVVCGVTQASLTRAGAGRVEWLRETPSALALMIISIPLLFLSTFGLIAISVWALFALSWLPTLAVLVATFLVWGFGWGFVLANLRRGESWGAILSVGIPLVLGLQLATTAAVGFLAWSFYTHSNL